MRSIQSTLLTLFSTVASLSQMPHSVHGASVVTNQFRLKSALTGQPLVHATADEESLISLRTDDNEDLPELVLVTELKPGTTGQINGHAERESPFLTVSCDSKDAVNAIDWTIKYGSTSEGIHGWQFQVKGSKNCLSVDPIYDSNLTLRESPYDTDVSIWSTY
ncbi:MAG: hypothetical protein DHS80DRAFT_24548 [Piptocephalis tieghemiana]|nr:MAG: hypothetical protein DHS80DRAFT_24548 [Piptocephalis tieghemiana]